MILQTGRNVACVFFFTLFCVGIYAQAQNCYVDGDFFLRSSAKFSSDDDNHKGIIRRGTRFRLIQRESLTSKSGEPTPESYKIEIISTMPGSEIQPSDTGYYIYKSNLHKLADKSRRKKNRVICPGIDEISVEAGVSKLCEGCATAAAADALISSQNQKQILNVVEDSLEVANTPPPVDIPVKPPEKGIVGPFQAGELDGKIKKYSESIEVQRMIDWAMANKSPSSGGLCYRRIKEAAANKCGPPRKDRYGRWIQCRNPRAPEGGPKGAGHNLTADVSTDYKDSYALSAKDRLKQDGFVNLMEIEPYKSQMKSPSEAPKGAILVYSSGVPCGKIRDCGHAELKIGGQGQPGYVSDYYFPTAINETPRALRDGSNYKLVGIMIKPKD